MGFLPGSDSGQARLTIESYATIDCTSGAKEPAFIAQSNPEDISYTFSISKDGADSEGGTTLMNADAAVGTSAMPPIYKGHNNMTLEFKIIADATGIVPVPQGMEAFFGEDDAPTIKPYLDLLQNTVYTYEKESHGPPYLKLIWGNVFPDSSGNDGERKPAVYKGMLSSYDVKIMLFSLQGEPIKAEITLKIDSLIDPAAKPLGNSPDLTHYIPINRGDHMSKHCNKIYGRFDTRICSAVAEYNGMIDWDLQDKAGTTLTFPSIHLLNELYIKKWEQLSAQQQENKKVKEESHYDYMLDLIGEKKAKQYFKTFAYDPNQSFKEWQASQKKTKWFA